MTGKERLPPLGGRELEIIRVLARWNAGVTYNILMKELCGCSGRAECHAPEFDNCRSAVQKALKSLRRKEMITRKRYKGEVHYYLTRRAKMLLLDLCGNL